MSINRNIQKARESKGLRQEEVSEMTRIPLSTYRNYEHGKQLPPADRLKAIALALGVSTDSLVFEEKEIEVSEEMRPFLKRFETLPSELKQHAKLTMRSLLMGYEAEMLASR